jgi:uncharacterized protein YdeI (BOF family)
MKKLIIAAALTLIAGSAFAQTTGPTGQTDNMTKPGMTNQKATTSGGATTGASKQRTSTDSMSNNFMNKDGANRGAESKDGDGMPKGTMSK